VIDASNARAVAMEALESFQREDDRVRRAWPNAAIGEPELVHDVAGPPTYWLVPLVAQNRAIGFVRVDGNGRTIAMGTFCQTPDEIEKCPAIVTGITADEAAELARDRGNLTPDETAAQPRFVHDGPVGREVWLVETSRDGAPGRWLFVGRGGLYERAAGVRYGDPGRE